MNEKDLALIQNPPLPNNFAPEFLVIDRGEGVYLFDTNGNRFLDFGSGISVNALGYGREDLAAAAAEQMKKLIHISNLYITEPVLALAEKLLTLGSFAAVHFGSSGSEANESALKYARLYSLRTKGENHYKILCCENAFHGRTMGALSCTPNEKYQKPFAPLIEGVEVIPFNDSGKLEETLDSSFACVIVEVVQGEGGLSCMTKEFAEKLNSLCKKHNVLCIADEVQTGLGRTGYPLASQWIGLNPDIVTLSKPLAGGLPLSATLIPAKVNDLLHVGEHGTTFGGGPVTTAVACKVTDLLLNEGVLEGVREKGDFLAAELEKMKERFPFIQEIRGKGLLAGIAVNTPEGYEGDILANVMSEARRKGLLILRSGANVLRLAPPLVIPRGDLITGLSIVQTIFEEIESFNKGEDNE